MPAGTWRELIASYPPEVQRLATRTRELVLRSLPGVKEMFDASARILGFGFGEGYAGMICVVMPTKVGVNLGFYRAIDLPDPQGLLEGTGKLHRHVKLRSEADLKKPGLKTLLKQADKAWQQRVRSA